MGLQRLVWTEQERYRGLDVHDHEVALDGVGETGIKPADLLPISLASCTAVTIVNVLRKQRQDLRSFEAVVESVRDPDPPWAFRSIAVRFVARGEVDPEKARKALVLSEERYCTVAATLRGNVDMTFEIVVEPS